MPDPFRHVRPGDRIEIPAEGYNAAIDAGKAERRRHRHGGSGPTLGAKTDPVVITIVNSTGGDLPSLSIVGLKEAVFLPAANAKGLAYWKTHNWMRSNLPGAGYAGKWGILLQPIKDGGTGRCCVAGLCQATINVTDANHLRAECSTSTTTLASSDVGSALIVWREPGTGSKRAIVHIGYGETVGNPQYEGMALIAVAQNMRGWGWLPAHPFDEPGS